MLKHLTVVVMILLVTIPAFADLVTIYSNLGPPNQLYDQSHGLNLSHSGNASVEWAMSFTPQADYLVVEVQIALGWVSGFNDATVSICEDKNGLPGVSIKDYPLHDLPIFGQSSRHIEILKYSPGVKVQGGKQYWIVAKSANPSHEMWNRTYNDAQGSIAKDQNNRGWTVGQDYLGALAIFGVRV